MSFSYLFGLSAFTGAVIYVFDQIYNHSRTPEELANTAQDLLAGEWNKALTAVRSVAPLSKLEDSIKETFNVTVDHMPERLRLKSLSLAERLPTLIPELPDISFPENMNINCHFNELTDICQMDDLFPGQPEPVEVPVAVAAVRPEPRDRLISYLLPTNLNIKQEKYKYILPICTKVEHSNLSMDDILFGPVK